MLLSSNLEIISLMPTAKWSRPEILLGYLDEEERVALEPLLGATLYEYLTQEYRRLRSVFLDITKQTIFADGVAKDDPGVAYATVTNALEAAAAHAAGAAAPCPSYPQAQETMPVSPEDMATVKLIRICQQIEFYKMLAHKAGLLGLSFNGGSGFAQVSAEGYDPATKEQMERLVKDAFMSTGRAVDSLLLYLEADAKGDRLFTEKWRDADAFYLHTDLLFSTARELNEYLDIKGERAMYAALVRDIRFCQNTYIKTNIGADLLRAIVAYCNGANETNESNETHESYKELATLLRTALAFYVEARREEVNGRKLARKTSVIDAEQALAAAVDYIADNLEALGPAAESSPIARRKRAEEQQAAREAERQEHHRHRRHDDHHRNRLFTGFPLTGRLVTKEVGD